MSKKIASQIMYTDDISVMWTDLKDRFRRSNETHIYQLTIDLAMIFQGTYTVSNFYIKLKSARKEVEAYGEVPICDCGNCTCNINGRIMNREEKLKVKKFLMGMNEEFS